MASKRIKGITVEIGGDTTQLDKALKGTNDKIKDASANLRDVERLLKMDPGNLDLIKQKQKLLSDAIGETEEKLKVLKTAQEQAADTLKKGTITPEQYDALGREIIECESSLKRLTSQQQSTDSATSQLTTKINEQKTEINQLKNKYSDLLIEQGDTSEEAQALKDKIEKLSGELSTNEGKLKNAKDAANKLGDEFKDTDKNAENLGGEMDTAAKKAEKAGNGGFTVLKGTLSGLATEAITGVINGLKEIGDISINAFKETDKGMDTAIAKTGATGKAAQDLKQTYNDVLSSIATDFDTAGAAIGEINTRFGFDDDELKQASTDFIKFARINNTDVESAVRLVARAMGDAGIEAKDYSTVLDILTTAGQKSGISIDTLAESLAKYGAPLRQLGMDTEESVALLSQWEATGVNTEIAFSGMKKAIANWSKEGKNGKEEFKKCLDEIAKTPDRSKAAQKAIEIFGTKAGPDLADAILEGRFNYQEFLKDVKNSRGTLSKTYDVIEDSGDKIQITAQKLKLKIGNTVGELLGKYEPQISKFLDGIVDKGGKLISFCVDNAGTIKNTLIGVGTVAGSVFAINKISTFTNSVSSLTGKMFKGIKSDANDAAGVGGVGTLLTKLGGAKGVGLIAVASAASYALSELFSPAEYDFSEYDKLSAKADEVKQKFDDWNESKNNALSAVDDDTKYYDILYQQLQDIVTENGKIKPEHEAQAKYIADELNPLLGDQKIAIENGIIKNWQNVNKEIKKTIQSQKILASIEAGEESYKDALINMDEAFFDKEEAYKALEKFRNDYDIDPFGNTSNLSGDILKEYDELNRKVIDTQETYDKYARTVDNYNKLLEASNSGSVTAQEAALIRLKNNYGDVTKMSWDELAKQQSDVAQHWNAIQKEYHNGTNLISDETYAAWQTLYRETTDAFNKISEENYKKAVDAGQKYSDGLDSKKQSVANSATNLKNAAENGMTSTAAAEKGEKAASDYVQALGSKNNEGHLAGWNLANATYNGINDFFNKYSMSSAARDAISGWLDVIKNTKYLDQAAVAASQLGVATLQGIRESLDIHSPSRKMGQQAEYALAGWFNEMENIKNITKATESGAKIGMATISGIGNVLSASPKMNILGTIDSQLTAITAGTMHTPQTSDTTASRIGSDILAALSRLSIPAPNVTLGDTMLFIDGDEVAARIEYRQKSRQIRTNGRG